MNYKGNSKKKKRGGLRLEALMMILCLVLLAACGKGAGSTSGKKTEGESQARTLADVNPIPEDGIITKAQFAGVAGEERQIQFTGQDENGISYVWTFQAAQIQNPADQNLKISFGTEGLEDIKKAANNASDALKMTMQGQGLICVPTLTVTLPESWQSDAGLLLKEQNGSLAKMSDVTIEKRQEEGTTSLTMTVTSLDGDCYVVGGITGSQNKGTGTEGSTGEETQDKTAGTGASTSTEDTSSGNAEDGTSKKQDKGAGSGDIKNDDIANDTSKLTCTISISCATILNNKNNLTPGKEEFVPSDGWILPATTVEFAEGDSVHDVLQAVCRANGIHMESNYTPMYDSAYVEGINQLYEFDCGELSGWMYSVNGWFPNYGCSKYTVSGGDVIHWVYTCDLGKDVGDNSMY